MRFLLILCTAVAAVLSCKAAEWPRDGDEVFFYGQDPTYPSELSEEESVPQPSLSVRRGRLGGPDAAGVRGAGESDDEDGIGPSTPNSVTCDTTDDTDSSSSDSSSWGAFGLSYFDDDTDSYVGTDEDDQPPTHASSECAELSDVNPPSNVSGTDTGGDKEEVLLSGGAAAAPALPRPPVVSQLQIVLRNQHTDTDGSHVHENPSSSGIGSPYVGTTEETRTGTFHCSPESSRKRTVRKLLLCSPEKCTLPLPSGTGDDRSTAELPGEADAARLEQPSQPQGLVAGPSPDADGEGTFPPPGEATSDSLSEGIGQTFVSRESRRPLQAPRRRRRPREVAARLFAEGPISQPTVPRGPLSAPSDTEGESDSSVFSLQHETSDDSVRSATEAGSSSSELSDSQGVRVLAFRTPPSPKKPPRARSPASRPAHLPSEDDAGIMNATEVTQLDTTAADATQQPRGASGSADAGSQSDDSVFSTTEPTGPPDQGGSTSTKPRRVFRRVKLYS